MLIDLIGVPLDLGQGRRGVDMGPSAIRYAGLRPQLEELGHTVIDRGNLTASIAETLPVGDLTLRYFEPIRDTLVQLASEVDQSCSQGHVPVVLGGDHSIGLGSVSGAAHNRDIGVLWIDAHGDFNIPSTSPSGNIHGMPLAALCGYGDERLIHLSGQRLANSMINPHHVALVAVRDLDPEERQLLTEAGVQVFATEYIDRYGMYETMVRAISVANQGRDGFYVSFDLDVLDPAVAPGVGTPVPGGITYREAHLAAELIAESGCMIGLDIVEVNPILDDRNRTATVAVEIALSALGKRVWHKQQPRTAL
ncbi:arginase [Herpetosiphon geysericola]|uniref:Arginase n=1 Tax=Herpetosiphon geysericola TaxID=70996 RepID=A0A0P6Y3G1_9CHLR|nr:arginase [Herpetosiphon geysericola]KPL83663.1 arginase [Herpetosiphon geysericola]